MDKLCASSLLLATNISLCRVSSNDRELYLNPRIEHAAFGDEAISEGIRFTFEAMHIC